MARFIGTFQAVRSCQLWAADGCLFAFYGSFGLIPSGRLSGRILATEYRWGGWISCRNSRPGERPSGAADPSFDSSI